MIARLLAMTLLVATSAHGDDPGTVRDAVEAGEIRPLSSILAAVQERYPGRILDVELERARDGRRIYDIELVGTDGRRLDVHVDAATGEFIDAHAGLVHGAGARPFATILRDLLTRHSGQIVDVELERDRNGREVYEIELLRDDGRALELTVDAANGRILDEHVRKPVAAMMALPDVLDRLAAAYPGTIVEVELERAIDGHPYYEIDVRADDGRRFEVRVDAVSGVVLGHEGGN
ncbi:PepSY domain-containing protein [Dokdonella sp.]|uniref:PepSY domain-containing protein n=1 Tax=Dokdonella sp. TaxID=2291710 RepID=UPI0025C23D4C|nr:PepSY domain-containing protein [Dokdonella sp.]MBX3690602.1 PepSY domain-containing protein [Dokdonella sp.]MCW5568150.1 PepSY domain-containing protein [Dokdonella sp.]